MIPCPICLSPTRVRETRGNQRRRQCSTLGCAGEIVTVEVPAEAVQVLIRAVGE